MPFILAVGSYLFPQFLTSLVMGFFFLQTYFTRVFFPVAYIIVSVVMQATITFTPAINKNPESLALNPSLYLETSEARPMYDSLTSLLYQDNLAASESKFSKVYFL